MTDPLSTGLIALVVALYLAAAVTDILWLRIPNVLVVALLGLFIVAAGGAVAGDRIGLGALALHHVLPGVVAFAIAAALFAAGKMGGGDVKLLGVTFLWGGTGLAPIMLMVLGIAGIVLLVLHQKLMPIFQYLVLRTASAFGRQWHMPKALQTTKGLPYALAIAPVGLVLAANLPLT